MDTGILALYAHATPVAKAVMFALVCMSVASWGIIFRKALLLRGAAARVDACMDRLGRMESLEQAMSRFKDSGDRMAWNLLRAGYDEYRRMTRCNAPAALLADNVRRSLRHAVSDEGGRLGAQLPLLATTANIAPFIGLFGTVWGIMDAFHDLAGAKSASIAAVAPGISEALIATAVGLGVAIPAAIGYNLQTTALNKIKARLVNLAGVILNHVMHDVGAVLGGTALHTTEADDAGGI